MGVKLYIGNLSFSTTEKSLTEFLKTSGTILSVNLIKDKFTGRSRGFAFVEIASAQEESNMIKDFHDVLFEGRRLHVSKAKSEVKKRPSARRREKIANQEIIPPIPVIEAIDKQEKKVEFKHTEKIPQTVRERFEFKELLYGEE